MITVATIITPITTNIPTIPVAIYPRLLTKFEGSKEIFPNILLQTSLTEEIENHTACNNRGNLSRNVYADRVHEQEVLRVLFKTELVNDTA